MSSGIRKFSYEHPRPGVATDIVVFTLIAGRVHVLIIERSGRTNRGRLALPGGFLDRNETLDACARRELAEETGVARVLPHHFGNYSEPGRDPRWVVSAAYFALVSADRVILRAGSDASSANWYRLSDARKLGLAFDHNTILEDALDAVAASLWTPRITHELLHMLPRHFTLSQFQGLCEAFTGEELDRGNFRRRLRHPEIAALLEATGKTEMDIADGASPGHRPAELFRATPLNAPAKPRRTPPRKG